MHGQYHAALRLRASRAMYWNGQGGKGWGATGSGVPWGGGSGKGYGADWGCHKGKDWSGAKGAAWEGEAWHDGGKWNGGDAWDSTGSGDQWFDPASGNGRSTKKRRRPITTSHTWEWGGTNCRMRTEFRLQALSWNSCMMTQTFRYHPFVRQHGRRKLAMHSST